MDSIVLDLKSGVLHDEIPADTSRNLGMEMNELLPSRRSIPRSNDLIGFEVNAASIDLSARYVIATAAHLSNQLSYSLELFKGLEERLNRVKDSSFPVDVRRSVQLLRVKVPLNLVATYVRLAEEFQLKWRKDRNIAHLEEMLPYLVKAESYRPNLYAAAILRAMYHFVKDRNIRLARREIAKCRAGKMNDATWVLDDALMQAYVGKLRDATRLYKVAFKKPTESRVIVEVEEFILWLLSEEPDKKQLYYCLGLINYLGKEDIKKAEEDFRIFLQSTNEEDFPEQREFAEECIRKIKA